MLHRLALAAVLLLTAFVYLRGLEEAPIAVGVDEARVAVHAQALAATGRDNNGTLAPIFFHITNPLNLSEPSDEWWQPMLFYLNAALFLVVPVSAWSLRFPTVCLALLDVLLIYFVGRRLFANAWYAVLAAVILALTPAHFLFGREAMDYFCRLPVALAWLWFLMRCLESDAAWLPPATGLLLGLGLYSHISSWIIMPVYLAATLVAFRAAGKPIRASVALVAGFVVPVLPSVLWLWFYPTLPHEMMSNYKVVRDFRWLERLDTYWDYFNLSYLFFSGGSNPMFSTRRAGVFLLALLPLLVFGIWSIVRRGRSIPRAVVLFGFFFAPVPIITTLPRDPKYYTPRDLLVVPFAALIAVIGIEWLLAQRGRLARVVAAALIVAIPVQFVPFARYYFGEYQTWSASRFDPLNLKGVAEYVIASDAAAHAPAVYMSEDVGESQAEQWKFYLLAHQRTDLWARSKPFILDQIKASEIPSGSLLVVDAANPKLDPFLATTQCCQIHIVNGVSGSSASAVLRRN